jgi:HSP20 family protein
MDMTLIRWEPFRELDDMFARYSPLFGRLGGTWMDRANDSEAQVFTPRADVSETETDYLIKAELPEVSKEDVKVTVDEDVVTIAGSRRKHAEHKDEKLHRVESFYGNFSRSFRLPEDADIGAIRAESKDGVLKVRVPKKPAPRAKTIEVQVN